MGTNVTLPAICSELDAKNAGTNAKAECQETLNAMSLNGNNVRQWLSEGCYKYEVNKSKEWVKPCPTKVICSMMTRPNKEPFCAPTASAPDFSPKPGP